MSPSVASCINSRQHTRQLQYAGEIISLPANPHNGFTEAPQVILRRSERQACQSCQRGDDGSRTCHASRSTSAHHRPGKPGQRASKIFWTVFGLGEVVRGPQSHPRQRGKLSGYRNSNNLSISPGRWPSSFDDPCCLRSVFECVPSDVVYSCIGIHLGPIEHRNALLPRLS